MKRPEWAAAGTFYWAWRTAFEQAHNFEERSRGKDLGQQALAILNVAHVISVRMDQLLVLPIVDKAMAAHYLHDVNLPFDQMYLSLEGIRIAPGQLKVSSDKLEMNVIGAIVTIGALPDMDEMTTAIIPVIRQMGRGRVPIDEPILAMSDGTFRAPREALWGSDDPDVHEVYEETRALAVNMVARILYFLESANVELVEGNTSRQERRQVARKGGRIALTVKVRQPKRRARPDGDEVAHVDYSHRWEVRGHYKHFPVGTRLADAAPEKLVNHEAYGLCRRVWCPPFVKGPQDKPLVPKIRIIS